MPDAPTGHGWITPFPDGARARCMGPPMCLDCVSEWEAMRDEEAATCRCGRLYQRLNLMSQWPACTGCGLPDEACRCVEVSW